MFATSGTYPWSFVTQIFHNGQPSHGGDRQFFEVMTSTLPKGTLGSIASLLAETIDLDLDRNHKLWNIVSYQRYILHMQDAGGMLLHINRKFTMGKLKSSLLLQSFVLNRPSLSISRCRSRYEADLSVYVVFFISSSMGYIRSTKSPNIELFSKRTSSI